MPKNKIGGKKFKQIKHNSDDINNRQLVYKDFSQDYAYVNKIIGNGRVNLSINKKEVVGIMRGNLKRKRQWVVVGNYVLVSKREFEDKYDIIHVYTEDEIKRLKKNGEIKTGEDIEDDELEFKEEEIENEDFIETL